jgi:hypothetical protein
MVNGEDFSGNTKYLTLYTRCDINRCRYNRVQLYLRYIYIILFQNKNIVQLWNPT